MEESTAPTLACARHMRALLRSASKMLGHLRKENITDHVVNDDELDDHYLQLEHYLNRSHDKLTGTIHYLKGNKTDDTL